MRLQIFILLSLILFSCYDKPANTSDKAFKEEMKEREIKKVSDGAIIEAAMRRGNIIADSAQKLLGSSLKNAIAEGGVQNAVKYCNLAAYPIMDSIETHFGVEVKRASLKVRNPDDKPNQLEKQLLEAYQYQIDTDDKLSSNIQKDAEDYLLFTKPITIENALCLKCHGEVGKYLKEEDYALIKSLYPQDNAIGHQMGDLRGMWSIRMSKKEIIKDL